MIISNTMAPVLLSLLILWATTATAVAAPVEDRMTSLPGYADFDKLGFDIYSGFVDSGKGMHSHYMFVENKESDNLIVWTNGGPGASSMFGLFVELGPFTLNANSLQTSGFKETGIPSLFLNKYSWSKLGSVVILNSPAPVGFSYCDSTGPSGDGFACGDWDDERTSKHNLILLESWLKKFPEYKKKNLFLTGESYAGIYIPTLARQVLDNGSDDLKHMLKGIAVGDGCVGTEVLCSPDANQGPFFNIQFLYGHGQISSKLFEEINNACTQEQLKYANVPKSIKCQKLLAKVDKEVGYFYEYSLYDECWDDNVIQLQQRQLEKKKQMLKGNKLFFGEKDFTCGGGRALHTWVSHKTVKKALHVSADNQYISGDNGAGLNYTMTEKNLLPFYRRLNKETDVRVLIYNGDTDPGLNSFVAQNWTRALGFKEIQEWRPWTLDGGVKVVGYVTRYENSFDFLTIRGSGHMVPEYKPAAAFEFFSKWIENKDWQEYKKPGVEQKRVYNSIE